MTGDHELLDVDIDRCEYVSVFIADQLFGIPVLQVQDVLGPQNITHIPLAPPEIAGSLNLRGRVVTAIDMRPRLGLDARPDDNRGMSIVVEDRDQLYSLMVDSVGEVLKLDRGGYDPVPPTMDARWRDVAVGVYQLDESLLIILDVESLLGIDASEAA